MPVEGGPRSTGFHLRKMFYEPLGGRQRVVAATFVPFLYNALFHVLWWAPMYSDVQPGYFPCLLLPPVALVAEAALTRRLGPRSTAMALLNFAALLGFFWVAAPYFYALMRVPSLHEYAQELLGAR